MDSLTAVGVIGDGVRAAALSRAVEASPLRLARFGADPAGADWDDIDMADVLVEATDTDPAKAGELLAALTPRIATTVVVATAAATTPVGLLARSVVDPGRFAGLHVFVAGGDARLLELVPTPLTRRETVARLEHLGEILGLPLVLAQDRPGFLVNRLLVPYLNQAIQAYDDGIASAEDIDVAVELGLGYPVGPLRLLDEIGLTEHHRVTSAIHAELPTSDFAPPPLLSRLIASGWHGDQVGNGFFPHPPTAGNLAETEALKDLVRRYAAAINDERWDDLLKLFQEDATISSPLALVTGHAGILRWFQATGKRFSTHVDTVAEVVAKGTMEAGEAAATIDVLAIERSDGRQRDFVAADDFVIEAGRIRSLRMIFDSAALVP
jgi:3-hydroxybutyryl-CoA dehydrogenase